MCFRLVPKVVTLNDLELHIPVTQHCAAISATAKLLFVLKVVKCSRPIIGYRTSKLPASIEYVRKVELTGMAW